MRNFAKLNIKNQLCLAFQNKSILCPNTYYGNMDVDKTGVFIKLEAVVEKSVDVHSNQLKLYIFFRVPNPCGSS